VGSSKNLGRATFRKMPEAGLEIAQKGLKNTFFCQIFAEAPSLARVWVRYFGFWGGLNPPRPPLTKKIFGTFCTICTKVACAKKHWSYIPKNELLA